MSSTRWSFVLLRWTARLLSLASIAIIAMFALGEPGIPTWREAFALLFFPVGVVIGLAIAWWKELPGAAIALSSLVIFHVVMFAMSGRLNIGPWFAVLTAPAAVFLVSAMVRPRPPACAQA